MKKKSKKALLVLPMTVMLALPMGGYAENNIYSLAATTHNSISTQAGSATVTPFADIIEWRYKVMDGKLYQRQYNVSKQQWIGQWQLCP